MNQSLLPLVGNFSRKKSIGQIVASSFNVARTHAVLKGPDNDATPSTGEANRTSRIHIRTLSRSSSWTSVSSHSVVTPGPNSENGESAPFPLGSPTLVPGSPGIELLEDTSKFILNPLAGKLGDPKQSPPIPKPNFDPNVPILSSLREESVPDITGQVTNMPSRALVEGGYSDIWTGTFDTKQVAIKHLRKQMITAEKAQRRLRREVGTWWCLCHDNIIPLLGIVYDEKFGPLPAMVSPWYVNGTAEAYLDATHSVSTSRRVDLFRDVAKGIRYLHTFDMTKIIVSSSVDMHDDSEYLGTKLVHGDLKPLNVLIDDNGRARLCDFGLLRLVRENAPTGMTTTSPHTGTTRYLCYELVADESGKVRPTTESDIWALACIGLEFIYSKPPYAEIKTDLRISNAIDGKNPPSPRPDNISEAESGLWDLFQQCWDIEPGKRPDAQGICQYLKENREKIIAERDEPTFNCVSALSD